MVRHQAEVVKNAKLEDSEVHAQREVTDRTKAHRLKKKNGLLLKSKETVLFFISDFTSLSYSSAKHTCPIQLISNFESNMVSCFYLKDKKID